MGFKSLLITIITIAQATLCLGQLNQNQLTNSSSLSNGLGVGEFIYTSKPNVKGVEGNPYLFEEWKTARIKIGKNSKAYKTDYLKYDVLRNYFDLLIGKDVKSINGIHVYSFEIIENESSKYFISAKEYNFQGSQLTGFLEVLYEGEYKLLERAYAYLKPATYNKALMLGEKNDKIYIKKEYYISDYNNNLTLIKKKKDLLKVIGKGGTKSKFKIDRKSLIELFKKQKL